MSAFYLSRRPGEGVVRLRHRDTGSCFMGIRAEPYYDLWPLSRRITRWVCWSRIFGINIRTKIKRLPPSSNWQVSE